jgi:hypothetical protein
MVIGPRMGPERAYRMLLLGNVFAPDITLLTFSLETY